MWRPAAFLAVATTIALAAPASADSRLVGRWDSQSRSQGGIGSMLYFTADGGVEMTVGAMIDSPYVVDGNRLYVGDGRQMTGPIEFVIADNRLIRIDPRTGHRYESQRLDGGGPGQPPLVGKWRSPHDTGATAIEEFTREGELFYRVPFRTDRGRYHTRKLELSIKLGNRREALVFAYRFDGDLLILTGDKTGREDKFKRVRRGPIVAEPIRR
jgi:hypothetical protein